MRLELTRATDLALRILDEVSLAGRRIKTTELAVAIGSTPSFVAKIAAPLVEAGFIVSTPGPRGGYGIGPDLGAASVLDVIEAVEGPTDTSRCALRGGPCGGAEMCAVHESWTEARNQLLDALAASKVTERGKVGGNV